MKHVSSPASSGLCGQACLAMITGHTLKHVRDLMPSPDGTFTPQLQLYLALHDYRVGNRLVRTRTERPPASVPLAILSMEWSWRTWGHWLVWADGRVYDPTISPYAKGKITHYLEVKRPRV